MVIELLGSHIAGGGKTNIILKTLLDDRPIVDSI